MTQIFYNSTRNNQIKVSAAEAIVRGIAEDGGLFVPSQMPTINLDWEILKDASYQDVACLVLSAFFTDFTQDEIKECVNNAYDAKFDTLDIAPIRSIDNNTYLLELFHGNTIAFKDMALSILPYLMTIAAKKLELKEEIVILTATSGDTGKAALAGFANVTNTKIIVFYPEDGVSEIQKLQMVTQVGNNTKVIAVKGNFDDAQSMVKSIFSDTQLKADLLTKGYRLSSANSINIGRLIPQIIYYIYAYAQLIKCGKIVAADKIDIVVPTGNFGNILAAYLAKQLGLPVRKFVCASNQNNVLVDFFNNGIYDRRRPFYLTNSPSMDILISSNLERLLYFITNRNVEKIKLWMEELQEKGYYQLSDEDKNQLVEFYSNDADDNETGKAIQEVYTNAKEVIDPHTAVAYSVYKKYLEHQKGESLPTVIAATASPYKFPKSVMSSFAEIEGNTSESDLIDQLHQRSQVKIPDAIKDIFEMPIIHQDVVEISNMKQAVIGFLS